MACILRADRILTDVIFTDETAYTIEDVKMYLRSAQEVDVAERSYQAVLNWIAKNPVRFQNPNDDDSLNKGEVWGRIDEDKEEMGGEGPCGEELPGKVHPQHKGIWDQGELHQAEHGA